MSEAHKRKRVDNMNELDHILEYRFETLSLEEKLEVNRLGPHHQRDFGISLSSGKQSVHLTWSGLPKKKANG